MKKMTTWLRSRGAPQPHLTPPGSDFACGGLKRNKGGKDTCTKRRETEISIKRGAETCIKGGWTQAQGVLQQTLERQTLERLDPREDNPRV